MRRLRIPPHRSGWASVLAALVNEIPDAEAAERDAFAQFADVVHGFGGRHRSGRPGVSFLLGEAFQGAGYHFLGRVVEAAAKVSHNELLAISVESHGEGHD